MNALDATTLLSIDNDDEVVSGMNVIDDTMDNEDNWDFEDDEILHSTTIMKNADENNIDKISHPQPQQQFVPPQQSILHNDNARQVADNYYGKDDNSNNSLSPINSNHEKGEREWEFDEEDDTDDKNNDDIFLKETVVLAAQQLYTYLIHYRIHQR